MQVHKRLVRRADQAVLPEALDGLVQSAASRLQHLADLWLRQHDHLWGR